MKGFSFFFFKALHLVALRLVLGFVCAELVLNSSALVFFSASYPHISGATVTLGYLPCFFWVFFLFLSQQIYASLRGLRWLLYTEMIQFVSGT